MRAFIIFTSILTMSFAKLSAAENVCVINTFEASIDENHEAVHQIQTKRIENQFFPKGILKSSVEYLFTSAGLWQPNNSFEFDSEGRLVSIRTFSDGLLETVVQLSYADARHPHNPSSVKFLDADFNTIYSRTTESSYDAKDRLIEEKHSMVATNLGYSETKVVHYSYDSSGKVVVSDASCPADKAFHPDGGNKSVITRDEQGRVSKSECFKDAELLESIENTFDAAGHKIAVEQREFVNAAIVKRESTEYDSNGNLVRTGKGLDADFHYTEVFDHSYTYDTQSRLIEHTSTSSLNPTGMIKEVFEYGCENAISTQGPALSLERSPAYAMVMRILQRDLKF